MSTKIIHPIVDTTSIDAAIAKLQNAIVLYEKAQALQGETLRVNRQIQRSVSSPSVKKLKDLPMLRGQTDLMGNVIKSQSKSVNELINETKGAKTLIFRVMRSIPFVREGSRVFRNVQRAQLGGAFTALAIFNGIMIAKRLLTELNSYFMRLEQEKKEMEAYVRDVRGLQSREDYQEWYNVQRQNFAYTRNIR